MNYIDTHIHTADLNESFDVFRKRLDRLEISKVIAVSSKPGDWPLLADWAERDPSCIVPAFGLHPWFIDQADQNWAEHLEEYLSKYPNALIGECGLDRVKGADFSKQCDVFKKHLELAEQYHRPILIHAVRAVQPMQNALSDFRGTFVLHGFNGRIEHLIALQDKTFYLAVNRSFLNNKDAERILRKVLPNRLLIETDAPFQGRIEDLPEICRSLARMVDQQEEDFNRQIYLNSLEILKND